MVLNSFETIHEGLVTKTNEFAGRENSFRWNALLNFSNNIGNSTYSPKWILMKKVTMQTMKVLSQHLLIMKCMP